MSTWLAAGAQTKLCFWVCLWECFQMRLVFESVESVKETTLPMWLGIGQSVEGLNRTKGFFPAWAGTFHFIFSCPRRISWTGICVVGPPGSQAFRLSLSLPLGLQLARADCGNFSASKTREPIPANTLYIDILFFLFLWKILSNTPSKNFSPRLHTLLLRNSAWSELVIWASQLQAWLGNVSFLKEAMHAA